MISLGRHATAPEHGREPRPRSRKTLGVRFHTAPSETPALARLFLKLPGRRAGPRPEDGESGAIRKAASASTAAVPLIQARPSHGTAREKPIHFARASCHLLRFRQAPTELAWSANGSGIAILQGPPPGKTSASSRTSPRPGGNRVEPANPVPGQDPHFRDREGGTSKSGGVKQFQEHQEPQAVAGPPAGGRAAAPEAATRIASTVADKGVGQPQVK